jgi:hypothetical protein
LERRIDGIISLLSTNPQPQPGSTTAPTPLTPESTTANTSDKTTIHTSTRSRTAQDGHRSIHSDAVLELLPNFRLTAQQASSYLATYQRDMMPKCPFVIIPHNIDAMTLYHRSKCLFWAIMATVAPLTVEIQADFKLWFRRHLAEEIVVRQQKRLELLQAILIHLTW